jgi:hypothetical protein
VGVVLLAYLGSAGETVRPTLATRLRSLGISSHEESFRLPTHFAAELSHVVQNLASIERVVLIATEKLFDWKHEFAQCNALGEVCTGYDIVVNDLAATPLSFPGIAWCPNVLGSVEHVTSIVEFTTFLLTVQPSRMLGSPGAECFSSIRTNHRRWHVCMNLEGADCSQQIAVASAQATIYRHLFEERPRQSERLLLDLIQGLPLEPPVFSASAHLFRSNLRRTTVPKLLQMSADASHSWETFRQHITSLASELRHGQRPLLGASLEAFLSEFPHERPSFTGAGPRLSDLLRAGSVFPVLYLGKPDSNVEEIRQAVIELKKLAGSLTHELRTSHRNKLYRSLNALRSSLYPDGYGFIVLPSDLSVDDNEEIWTQANLTALIGMRPGEI